jgi:ANTAR domain-containing protein
MDEERAFHFLVRASQTGNVKIRDIAQELVDRRNCGDRDPDDARAAGTSTGGRRPPPGVEHPGPSRT